MTAQQKKTVSALQEISRAGSLSGKSSLQLDIRYLADCRETVPILAAWIYDEWSYLYPKMTFNDVETFLRKRMNKEELPLAFVAFEAGEPVGTVSLKTFDMEGRRDLRHWLTSLYVSKSRRRRGIGSRLVQTAEKKAVELKIDRLFLFTTKAELARFFYAKLGWSVKEQTLYHSCPIVIMERDLP